MNDRLVIHPRVPNDLDETMDWLASQATGLGDRYAVAVGETFNDLLSSPGKGSIKRFRQRIPFALRSWPVLGFRKYLVFYHVIEGGIRILAVMHGARNIDRLIRDRL